MTTSSATSATMTPLSPDELHRIDAWWRAANYLSVGQIYLMANPLLREPLLPEHVKPRLLGHWGTTPGLNFVYAHLNRAIADRDLDMIYIIGPGHGGPGVVASAYLEGSYSETYSDITLDEEGMARLFKQFSFPGGIPSHVAPGDAGLDPRGRGAGVLALSRLRRGVRQPRSRRGCDRRRWRGGDRSAGDELAQHQVRRSHSRRSGPADPAPERLQDRQPDRPGPDPRGGARPAAPRLRSHAALRHRRRPRDHAPGLRGHVGPRSRRDPGHPTAGSLRRAHRATRLADDRAAQPQGLDRPQGGRRSAHRGVLALPPGALRRRPPEREPSPHPRGVVAQLPTRGAVRRGRGPGRGHRRTASTPARGG